MGIRAAGLPHEPAALFIMSIKQEQINRIREIHRNKYGKDFESDTEAKEYLDTLCRVFAWLLKNSPEQKNKNQSWENSKKSE